MVDNWSKGVFGDVAEIIMGQSPKGADCNESGDGIPLLNGPTEFSIRHPYPTQFTIDPKKYADEGDLLFCVRGSTTGKMNWADQRYAIGRGIGAFRHKLGPEYHAYLRALVEFKLPVLLQSATGSTFPNVSRNQLLELEIDIPTATDALKISRLIDNLDQRIYLNNKTNQTLEQMAQALFKSWFVDFDPVIDNALEAGTNISDFPEALQYRAEQRKKAQQLPDFKPLPDDILALCPSEFEQTEEPHFGIFGWMPKGWKVSELVEFIKFANGKAKKSTSDGSYPIYGANGIIGNTDEVRFKNAVIVGRVGAYCGAIEYCREGFWSSDNTIVATSKLSEEQIPHILYLLKHLNLNQYAGGAAQPLLNQTTLNKLKVPFSGIDFMMQFNEIVDALLVKQIKNIEQTAKLNEIRDTLLPKLISGELQLNN
jgi:type I restriction enzyme S subunit